MDPEVEATLAMGPSEVPALEQALGALVLAAADHVAGFVLRDLHLMLGRMALNKLLHLVPKAAHGSPSLPCQPQTSTLVSQTVM